MKNFLRSARRAQVALEVKRCGAAAEAMAHAFEDYGRASVESLWSASPTLQRRVQALRSVLNKVEQRVTYRCVRSRSAP